MPPLPPPTAIQPSTAVFAPIFDINYSFCSFADYPYLVKLPGSLCYQFYLAQTEEARYLKTILEDHVKFPTFPRRLNGNVIVDCHPDQNIIPLLFKNPIPISSAMSSLPSLETILPDFRIANPFGLLF
jgi:hypothetical protein